MLKFTRITNVVEYTVWRAACSMKKGGGWMWNKLRFRVYKVIRSQQFILCSVDVETIAGNSVL